MLKSIFSIPALPRTVATLMLAAVMVLPADARVTRSSKGSSSDVNPTLSGPAYNLGGGGPDVDEAIQGMINQVRGCTNCSTKLDVVVIRAAGTDAYNEAIAAMQGVNSVQTLIINNRDDANSRDVVDTVKKAEVVFFAGGDQCEYVRDFKDTDLEEAVKSVAARGGGIGGTSAGTMIQSSVVYNACSRAVETKQALADPYEDIGFTYNFFLWRNLEGTIFDTHFNTRERMGRLMAFIARQIEDRKADKALGMAVSEGTSVLVDKNGMAQVVGKGAAYFVFGDHQPEVCEPHSPLTFSNYKIWKRTSGQTFDLKNRPTTGYYLRSVKRGQISADPY